MSVAVCASAAAAAAAEGQGVCVGSVGRSVAVTVTRRSIFDLRLFCGGILYSEPIVC